MSILTHVSAAGGPLKTRQQSKSLLRMLTNLLSSLRLRTSLKFMKMLLWTPWLGKWLLVTPISPPVLSGISFLKGLQAALKDKHISTQCSYVYILCGCFWYYAHRTEEFWWTQCVWVRMCVPMCIGTPVHTCPPQATYSTQSQEYQGERSYCSFQRTHKKCKIAYVLQCIWVNLLYFLCLIVYLGIFP